MASRTSYENLYMLWNVESGIDKNSQAWISNYIKIDPNLGNAQISVYGRLLKERNDLKFNYIGEIYIRIPKCLKETYKFITEYTPYTKQASTLIKIRIPQLTGSIMQMLLEINKIIKILFDENFSNIFNYEFSFIKL